MGPRQGIAGASALVAFGLVLAFTVLEITVRALHLVPTRFWEPDEQLGTRLIAGKQGWWTQEEMEFRVPVRVNSAGLRDVEHTPAKPPGVFRVLVLGDSFIEALQVRLEDTFGRRLEQELQALSGTARYEVISLGVSGYGTASEFLAYREMGRRYDPDLVLLAFYPGNDVRNNSPTLEPQLRPLYGPDGMLIRVSPVEKAKETPASTVGRLVATSHAYRFLRKTVMTQHPQLAAGLVKLGLVKNVAPNKLPSPGGVPLDYWVYAPVQNAAWEDAWSRTEELLLEFRRTTQAEGRRFVVVLVPGRDQIEQESWKQIVEGNSAMRKMAWDLYKPERRIMLWCRRAEVNCFSLTETFLANRDPKVPLHYHHDGHWTPAGHRLAANTVARLLHDGGLLSP